jgi:diacylglycerol kinase family enzyme
LQIAHSPHIIHIQVDGEVLCIATASEKIVPEALNAISASKNDK